MDRGRHLSNNARARSVSADGVARTIGRVRRQYGARQSGSLEYDGPSTVRPTAVGNIHQNETRPVEDAESWWGFNRSCLARDRSLPCLPWHPSFCSKRTAGHAPRRARPRLGKRRGARLFGGDDRATAHPRSHAAPTSGRCGRPGPCTDPDRMSPVSPSTPWRLWSFARPCRGAPRSACLSVARPVPSHDAPTNVSA